ncbi:hypothetical protein DRB96_42130 [Streptomyces sp. ICC1]|nr:hypothetical protein DRB89_42190 [Streptomyces sp. ICC4]AWZ18635.1 hypothetical protein DRB96_42130 [Streptomyces sp. ICC1]
MTLLAGTTGGAVHRTCTVRAGYPLVFPLVNRMGQTEADCTQFMAEAEGSATLDGKEVAHQRYEATDFHFLASEDNPFTGDAGRYEAKGCGLWVLLPPLAEGPHTLTIRGESGDFTTAADYDLRTG